MKRLCDIVLSTLGLIIFCPLFLVLSLWVALDSTGGVFYRQTRVGRGGRDFKLLKFRSMRIGSDKKGLITVGEKDARITKSGYYIRKYKFDELPQLINVLKGDMSLVGTRPPTVDEWEQYDLKHRVRMSIKPGITGLWQISGRSKITDFDEVVRLDSEYIRNWDLGSDIKIILKTIVVVLKRDGAE